MKEAKAHLNRHAVSRFETYGSWPENQTIYGSELESGEVLEGSDLYESTSGDWVECPCPGITLQAGPDVIWVRPCE